MNYNTFILPYMGWKTIFISSEQKLKIEENHLLFIKESSVIRYHIETIDLIMIDNIKSVITLYTLIKLAENNIALIINNQSHDPLGIYLPFNTHHKPVKNLNLQICLDSNQKEILHKKIIYSKITNQFKIANSLLQLSKEEIANFEQLIKQITIGDKTNREGHAAKLFYKLMYGSNFVRFTDDGINNALNFGYKILASRISSSIVKYGLNPALGIFHRTETNYFNLSYDFIEPFRPLVDYMVKKHLKDIDKDISLKVRLSFLKILDFIVHIDGKMSKVRNAVDYMVKSFVSFLNSGDYDLFKLPEIVIDYDLEDFADETSIDESNEYEF